MAGTTTVLPNGARIDIEDDDEPRYICSPHYPKSWWDATKLYDEMHKKMEEGSKMAEKINEGLTVNDRNVQGLWWGDFGNYSVKLSSKKVVPDIKDYKIFNGNTVKVFFKDGSCETAVCHEGDVFDLRYGITICLLKRALDSEGKTIIKFDQKGQPYDKFIDSNGTKAYNDLMRQAERAHKDTIKKKEDEERAKAEAEKIAANRKKKKERYKKRRAERREAKA